MNLGYHQSKTIELKASKKEDLLLALDLLKQGRLVALPTETVYGLAANGLSSSAIQKVFAAKNRPANNPLILHTDSILKAHKLLDFSQVSPLIEERFFKLAKSFWPGPLTIIAPKDSSIPKEATAGLKQAAVRIPNNSRTLKILSGLDFPLVMPSANLSTRPSPTCASHVLKTLAGRIDAVVDDGPCPVGIESTVVRIDKDIVEILRPGMFDKNQLEMCLEEKILSMQKIDDVAPSCPGQSQLHYSPDVFEVKLCSDESIDERWSCDDVIIARTRDFLAKERFLGPRPVNAITLLLNDDPARYGQQLYDALYRSENSPDKRLSILVPKDTSGFTAILDRIGRAAS